MLRKGQHFYIVNRCTLVSLQVEKESLQIFRIINNSLHRCQGQNWKLGSCPQPGSPNTVTQTASLPWEPPHLWPWGGGGWQQRILGPATGLSVLSHWKPTELGIHRTSVRTMGFLKFYNGVFKCFQPQPTPCPLLPRKLKSHKSNSLYPNQELKSLSPKLYS